MRFFRIELVPLGDLVMVVPNEVGREISLTDSSGLAIEKPQSMIDREEWEQSEVTVWRHGTGVPKWMQRLVRESRDGEAGDTVIIARHMATKHRMPVGPEMVEFLLIPSAGILIRKDTIAVAPEDAERVADA